MVDTPAARPPGGRARRLMLPHLRVSEVTITDVPAKGGIIAHKNYTVTTACGEEIPTTLVTRNRARVRCPDCKAAMEQEAPES